MEPLAISWLIASSSSPLVAVLALWTIYVFHTFRRRWRTVDLFLLTIVSQELMSSIFTFCYAIIRLINPPQKVLCSITQWGLIATRTFQVATLTSMVVDRSLTVRWPYRYRFSVRRNQIRYHIGVLVLVSILVGVAAIFAKTSKDSKHCYLQPEQWDIKYIVFLLSLYGILMLMSFICMIQVEIYRSKHGTKLSTNGSFQLPECASPDLPSATGMNSPLDTQSSTGSTRALHRPSRQASRRPYGKNAKGTSDLRWPSVALTCLLGFSLNHIPHLVLMSIMTWYPALWFPWHEAILTWLGLLEGLFIPLLLFCKDQSLHNALRRTFQRRSGALSPLVGDDGPFQMYFDKDHFRKRGTFGSVTPVGIITNYRRTPGKRRRCKGKGAKYTLPGLHGADSVLAKSCFGAGFGLGGAEPLSKLSCADLTSLEMWREEEEEENFYASLSDDFSTFSCKSGEDSALSEDIRINEELYGGSFTTIANDDFEFHDTRPCGGEVKMRPALTSTPPPQFNSFNAGISRNVSFRESVLKKDSLQTHISQGKGNNELFDFVTSPVEEDQKDPNAFILPASEWKYKVESDLSSPSDMSSSNTPNNKYGTLSRHPKSTSFSMNDLDLIHYKGMTQAGDITTFMLPVKSESTMSLYRLNVERDIDQMVLTPSKSENNVNGDSGFGSGAQSTNPVWSGFLCRKPSDPFWNIRKPSVAAVVTPTKNYPGILHPRMRKIPWISAWKKLDGNNDIYNRSYRSELQSKDKVAWNDPTVYSKKADHVNPHDNQVTTIEEELSDVGTPICNADYNLNIFAKESGILLENAYGRIERDDCGVKVNFYGENVQYDAKEAICENKEYEENIFDSSFESNKAVFVSNRQSYYSPSENYKIENHVYEPLNVKKNDANMMFLKDNIVNNERNLSDNINDANDENSLYQCDPTLNDGHYENLFGTKENIFAHCDQYQNKIEVNLKDTNLERKCSSRRDSGRFKNPNTICCNLEASSVYGQLKKPERKESFHYKNEELQELQYIDTSRKESDNRGRKCGIKRKESKTRSDKKPDIQKVKNELENSDFTNFDSKENNHKNRNKIEIEMKNVSSKNDLNYNSRIGRIEVGDDFRINLSRRESQNEKVSNSNQEERKSKLDQPDYVEIRDERGVKIIRRESHSRSRESNKEERKVDGCDRIYVEPKGILWQPRIEHKNCGNNMELNNSGRRVNVERGGNNRCISIERNDSKRRVSIERNDSNRRISVERNHSNRRVSAERSDGVRRFSAERKDNSRRASVERSDSDRISKVQRIDSGRSANIHRRESDRRKNIERQESGRVARIERRESEKNMKDNISHIEKQDSGRLDSNIYSRREEFRNGISRRDSQNKKFGEVKNEGLWVNAIPFHVQSSNEEENGNAPKRESRKEAYDLHRSPRKSNIVRKESKGRIERNEESTKWKVNGNRCKKEKLNHDQLNMCPNNKIQRKEYKKWPPQNSDPKDDSHFDDFIKYRDKCEDNFSHIQNLNRETSAEREHAKMEQLKSYGKLNDNVAQNGEVYLFDTFQEQKRSLFQNSKPVSDINDNCGQKKLAITDFL